MGPLALVDTIVAGVNLDVERLLRMGPGKTMIFKVPDTTVVDRWTTLLTLTRYFNRITAQEKTLGDGSEVIFRVADPNAQLVSVLTVKDLHVEVEGVTYSVARVPPVASNEAQVFDFTCKVRTLRNKFFDNKK